MYIHLLDIGLIVPVLGVLFQNIKTKYVKCIFYKYIWIIKIIGVHLQENTTLKKIIKTFLW